MKFTEKCLMYMEKNVFVKETVNRLNLALPLQIEKTVHRVERRSGKVPGSAIRKEGHADSLREH